MHLACAAWVLHSVGCPYYYYCVRRQQKTIGVPYVLSVLSVSTRYVRRAAIPREAGHSSAGVDTFGREPICRERGDRDLR